jgi:hypothetical protein
MLAHPTLELLHALGLHGMAKGYQEIDANPEARFIGIPTLADAVLDRVVHNAYRIELSGESLRKRQAPETAA